MEQLQVKAGLAIVGAGLEARRNVCITIRDGVIESIEPWSSCGIKAIGGEYTIATPQPAIAHVHSGDSLFPEYGVDKSLEELVAPPNGLKHKLLDRADRGELARSITSYYRWAWRLGVGLLGDFREGGGLGCSIAKEALRSVPPGLSVVVLGRPGPEWPHGCDGLGLSSPLDHPLEEVKRLARRYRPSMTHVAETREARLRGDLEAAVEAGFDAVVHGTFLDREDLETLESKGMGLVLCARSNMWHGLGIPPVRAALETLSLVGLGTDNASWMPPNPWREAEAALLVARLEGPTGEWLARRLLRALFVDTYVMLGHKPRIPEEGSPARFLVFDGSDTGVLASRSVYYGLLKRLGGENLVARVDDGELSFL